MVVGPWGLWSAVPAGLGAIGLLVDAASKKALADSLTEFKVLMHDCLQPLARSLLSVATKTTVTERKKALPNALWVALTAAIAVTSTDGSRASFFRRKRHEGEDYLVPDPDLSYGRGDDPVSWFARTSGEGREVWRAAEAGEVTFYENIRDAPPPHMDATRVRSYQTFITAPVKKNGTLIGLLTINARNPGDLTSDDAGIMRVVATLAGVAITISGGEWPESETR